MNKYLLLLLLFSQPIIAREIVNDVTQINPVEMDKVLTPTTNEEVMEMVRSSKGPVSIGGGRYSMGGQTAIDNGIQIDMRKMNKVIKLDVPNKKITVQAGIRWRDIQDAIDPHNLSIKIMQTYSNFTVGGSLSVNVHGRYIGQGPLIRSVDSIKVVLADGTLVHASPVENSEIFYGAIGGYGGIGVIVEATLQLADNIKLMRQVEIVKAADYQEYFRTKIRDNTNVVLHNGDLYPPDYERVSAVNWVKTNEELTITDRMIPRNQKYWLQPKAVSVISSLPFGKALRSSIIDPMVYKTKMVVWRNYEASYDVAELEPSSREKTTYVLQEYFVPVRKFNEFIPKMRDVFNKHDVNVVNVSIRHALPDTGSLLAWATEEVFCFVIYISQGTTPAAKLHAGTWTREMQDEILSVGGRWYLPYQIHATDDQFQRAYTGAGSLQALKQKIDPDYRFKNKLWERYYMSVPSSLASASKKIPDYKRGEEQSYLALPEWYIVFNSEEYAEQISKHFPSTFPYWQSVKEYWSLYSTTGKLAEKYPSNFGYKAMLWVIGSSYSAELLIKGAYENTIGRLTELLTSDSGTDEDRLIAEYNTKYGAFIHVRPFFEFSYWSCLKDFWSKTSFFGENFIRKTERKIWFSTEFLVKTIYGWAMGVGSGAAYGAEAERIMAIVNGDEMIRSPHVKVLASENGSHLISVVRYDVFRDLVIELSATEDKLVEISGNRHIMFTVTGKKGLLPETMKNSVAGVSRIVTDANQERLLIAGPVSSLISNVKMMKEAGYKIEHVFDY